VEIEVLHKLKNQFYKSGNGSFTWVEMDVLHRWKWKFYIGVNKLPYDPTENVENYSAK
jgi:hypothetical protein